MLPRQEILLPLGVDIHKEFRATHHNPNVFCWAPCNQTSVPPSFGPGILQSQSSSQKMGWFFVTGDRLCFYLNVLHHEFKRQPEPSWHQGFDGFGGQQNQVADPPESGFFWSGLVGLKSKSPGFLKKGQVVQLFKLFQLFCWWPFWCSLMFFVSIPKIVGKL